jgi:hypothetical protein
MLFQFISHYLSGICYQLAAPVVSSFTDTEYPYSALIQITTLKLTEDTMPSWPFLLIAEFQDKKKMLQLLLQILKKF